MSTTETHQDLDPREVLARVSALAPGVRVTLEFLNTDRLKNFRSRLYMARARAADRAQAAFMAALETNEGAPTSEPAPTGWEDITTQTFGSRLYIWRLGPDDAIKVTWPDPAPL